MTKKMVVKDKEKIPESYKVNDPEKEWVDNDTGKNKKDVKCKEDKNKQVIVHVV